MDTLTERVPATGALPKIACLANTTTSTLFGQEGNVAFVKIDNINAIPKNCDAFIITEEQIKGTDPIALKKALRQGHTFVFKNITDPQLILKIVGIHVPGTDVFVKYIPTSNAYNITAYDSEGPDPEIGYGYAKGILNYRMENDTSKYPVKFDIPKEIPVKSPSGAELMQDPLRIVSHKKKPFHEVLSYFNSIKIDNTPGDEPPPSWVKSKMFNLITNAQVTLGQQVATIEIVWSVEMYGLANNKQSKYMRIISMGAGADPSSLGTKKMDHDDKYDRGYFQESLDIMMYPYSDVISDGPNILTLFDQSPQNINGATTVTSSTGFELSQDGASFSCESSETTTVNDFDIVNKSNSIASWAEWSLMLSSVGTGIERKDYEEWEDILKMYFPIWGATVVRELPILAQDVFQPKCQAIWIADGAFNGEVVMCLAGQQNLRRTWIENGWNTYYWTSTYNQWTTPTQFTISFNLND